MDFSAIAFTLDGRAISWAEVLVGAGVLGLVLIAVTLFLAWQAGRVRREEALEAVRRAGELELRLAEMAGQLRQFSEHTSAREVHFAQTLDDRLDRVSQRLGHGLTETSQRTSQSLQQLHERLAVIDSAQANIAALSTEMIGLRDILSNKQARGAYGQARMEAIIRDGLHSAAYSFQTTLSNGTRPDCLVKLPESDLRVVIDAKFPLEAFNALKATEGDDGRKQAEQRLRRDVGHHIKEISTKYLIAGETHETAIMFVPSESIYADLYEHFEDVMQKAHRAQVVIASPNILMLLVQTMQAIFKDARMREQAGLIQGEVVRLLEDVERLSNRVYDLQRHFGQANQDIEKILVSSDKISKRGHNIEQLELQETDAVEVENKPKLVAGE